MPFKVPAAEEDEPPIEHFMGRIWVSHLDEGVRRRPANRKTNAHACACMAIAIAIALAPANISRGALLRLVRLSTAQEIR